MKKIRQQRKLVAQREEVENRKKRMTVLDVEDPKEIEYILAVRYFHEYELTDDHLRVAQISLVKVLNVAIKNKMGTENAEALTV